jgi:hypothetical protein
VRLTADEWLSRLQRNLGSGGGGGDRVYNDPEGANSTTPASYAVKTITLNQVAGSFGYAQFIPESQYDTVRICVTPDDNANVDIQAFRIYARAEAVSKPQAAYVLAGVTLTAFLRAHPPQAIWFYSPANATDPTTPMGIGDQDLTWELPLTNTPIVVWMSDYVANIGYLVTCTFMTLRH